MKPSNGINFTRLMTGSKNRPRPVQYERAENDYNTDVLPPQYPHPRLGCGIWKNKDGRGSS